MKMKFYIPPDKREQDSDIFPYDNKNDNNKRLRTEQQGRLLYTEPLFHHSFFVCYHCHHKFECYRTRKLLKYLIPVYLVMLKRCVEDSFRIANKNSRCPLCSRLEQ